MSLKKVAFLWDKMREIIDYVVVSNSTDHNIVSSS